MTNGDTVGIGEKHLVSQHYPHYITSYIILLGLNHTIRNLLTYLIFEIVHSLHTENIPYSKRKWN